MYPKSKFELATDFLLERVKNERVQSVAARSVLLLGLYFTVASATTGEEPSRAENEKVMACADKLSYEAEPVFSIDVPKACAYYVPDFREQVNEDKDSIFHGEVMTVLPDRGSFKQGHLKGAEYDEEVRDEHMHDSMRLLALSGLIYVVGPIGRALRRAGESNGLELDSIKRDANQISRLSDDEFNSSMQNVLRNFKKNDGSL